MNEIPEITNNWEIFLKEKCLPIEDNFLGEPFKDRTLLIRALLRKAKLNEPIRFTEMQKIKSQEGLDTLGDAVIYLLSTEHAYHLSIYQPVQIHNLREKYRTDPALSNFSMNSIELQKYVIWGDDEIKRQVWVNSDNVLADCFEALVGAVYLDQGIKGVKKMFQKINFFENIDKLTQ